MGIHIATNEKVAVKIVAKNALSQDGKVKDALKKLEREITIMRIIKHPHVLQILDVYESEKELYLVLEHVDGGELFEYMVKRGRLSEFEALNFFQQIIFGLNYCHGHLIW